jgi:hypothetical protein
MQWLQNPNQSNADNLNNVRREACRHFRNKKKEYLKAKINELETNSKNKNIGDFYRDISDFKKGYQPRTNVVKEEKGDMVAFPHSILARWTKHFFQLLNVHWVNDVRQTEIRTAKPLVPEPSASEFEMAIEKLKKHKSPDIDQIPAELIKAEVGQFVLRSINLLILFGIKRNCLSSGRSQSLYLFIRRVMKHIAVIIEAYHFCQPHTKFYPTSFCQG